MIEDFEDTGRVWFRNLISEPDLSALDQLCNWEGFSGKRLHLYENAMAVLGPRSSIGAAVQSVLPDAGPVRLLAFDKTRESNWALPWHQDRVIATNRKSDVPGFKNWSRKEDRWHCEPPISVLEKMVFVQVHLDIADSTNGAMEIAHRSHKSGIVPSANAAKIGEESSREVCAGNRGDILVMKMLLLHKSNVAEAPKRRRALRIDYASCQLPAPLEWAYAVS